jgi:GMP synthase (glutamine-hydrolysing)
MKKILILDCGSHLLDKLKGSIHAEGAATEIVTVPMSGNVPPVDARYPVMQDIAIIDQIEPAGIVISGSPHYIYTKLGRVPPPGFLDAILRNKMPVLGICGGHELLAHLIALHETNGKPPRVIGKNPSGKYEPEKTDSNPCEFAREIDDQASISCGNIIFDGLPPSFPVWMYHVHQVLVLPPKCISLGKTPATPIAAIACFNPQNSEPIIFGVQFHPEVSPAKTRRQIFHNFLERCDD